MICGAVNTHHLSATFTARLMDSSSSFEEVREPKWRPEYAANPFTSQLPVGYPLDYDDNSIYFEWSNYTYEDFKKDWPPIPGIF